MGTERVGFGRRGGGIFPKAVNLPAAPTVSLGREVSQTSCSGLTPKPVLDEAGAAEGGSGRGRRAPCSALSCSVSLLSPSPASSPFAVLVELFARWHGEPGWQLDPDGGKNGKKSVCGCWFVFLDGSSLQHSLSCGYKHTD